MTEGGVFKSSIVCGEYTLFVAIPASWRKKMDNVIDLVKVTPQIVFIICEGATLALMTSAELRFGGSKLLEAAAFLLPEDFILPVVLSPDRAVTIIIILSSLPVID